MTDPLLSQVLDQRRHQERLAHTGRQVRDELEELPVRICQVTYDNIERSLVRRAQVEAGRDFRDQVGVVADGDGHETMPFGKTWSGA